MGYKGRALYTDVDMVNFRDIAALYKTDLEGKAFGMVWDALQDNGKAGARAAVPEYSPPPPSSSRGNDSSTCISWAQSSKIRWVVAVANLDACSDIIATCCAWDLGSRGSAPTSSTA